MQIYNFSAGPAMLPAQVLRRAQQELCNWNGMNVSVMEIGHRTAPIVQMIQEIESDLRELLNIPDNYKVIFCQGGARAQFSAIPMNLLGNLKTADYVETGFWSQSAAKEAEKYCTPRVIQAQIDHAGKRGVLSMNEWDLDHNAAYLHYCPNETIDGIEIKEDPCFSDKIVIADCSSMLLSRQMDVSRYGVIDAAAQKNMGPPGLTVVIIREDLIGHAQQSVPGILNYQTLNENHSLYNTPPVFSWYMTGLVLKWLKSQGGIREIEKINLEKSQYLYSTIDKSHIYHNDIFPENRSGMNVPFHLNNTELETLFLEKAEKQGLYGLKGHHISGGIRASIYNAMPIEGVNALVDFMKEFETHYG